MAIWRAIAAAISLGSLSSCNIVQSHDCPDSNRLHHVDFATDYGSSVVRVDDCLAEYGTKLAQGTSSDHDAATATMAYCGSYATMSVAPDDIKADRDKEAAEALRIIIAARTFKCPAPRERALGKDI